MDKQTKEAREMTKQLKGKEKWRNFWYYYRYHILVLVFAVIILSYTLTDCVNKTKYDLSVSCYSATVIDSTDLTPITGEFEKIISDIDGNGEINTDIFVSLASLTNPSEQSQAVIMKLSAELAGGDSFGYILDEEFYGMVNTNYSECIESVIPINDIPLIKDTFNLREGQKLYWMTKAVYETEKNKPEKIAAHENAVKIQNYLEELSK